MYRKVLVCLDGSRLAEEILPFALEQAKRFDSTITLFRAYSAPYNISLAVPGTSGVPMEIRSLEKQLIEDEKEAEIYLQSLSDKLQTETTFKVSYAKVLGAAGQAIVEYCKNEDMELIAIATHGRSGLGRVLLGSVADYVIRHSSVPILLFRPTGEKT